MIEHNPLDHEDTQALCALIEARTGLVLKDHRLDEMKRTVTHLLPDLRTLATITQHLTDLSLNHPTWQELIRGITIGETYFFRNQAHFEVLRNHVLPEMIELRRAANFKQLRFWSAGCATGEEPYSLALLLRELLHDIDSWVISILATDINTNFLDIAQQGLYSPRSFRNETPDYLRDRWFEPDGNGYRLRPTIREMVMFRKLNLVNDFYPSPTNYTANIDLIMCRNVTIYFDMETTRQVITRFNESLNTDGWLIVGHSEPQTELYKLLATRNFTNAVFYQKRPAVLPATAGLPELPTCQPLPRTAPLPTRHPVPTTASLPTRHPVAKPAPLPKRPPRPAPEVLPTDPWLMAQQAADREDWDEALHLLAELEKTHKMKPELHYLRGLVQMQMDDVDKAFHSMRQALYCDPNCVLAAYALGEIYEQRRNSVEAARLWHSAQATLARMDSEQKLPFADDLTVEMLNDLLTFRLEQLGD